MKLRPLGRPRQSRGDALAFEEPGELPAPAFAGRGASDHHNPGCRHAATRVPGVLVPGEEQLEDGELRVTVLASGNPWVTRAQASGSVLVEVGNPQHDLFVIDLGSGSLANSPA
jgi:ribonuclease Z